MGKKAKLLLELFLIFFKIGAITFGGGYAMVPVFSREFSEKRKYITDDEMLEIIAIAESTPGPIAINSATFIGYKVAGTLGSVCATAGVVLPSLIIILLVSFFYQQFKALKAVQYAFYGIKSGVIVLVLSAFIKMLRTAKKDAFGIIAMIVSFVVVAFTPVSPIIVSISFGVLGIIYFLLSKQGGRE